MRSRAALSLGLVLLAAAAGCRGPAGEGESAAGAPIVLISIDTLRADRLPVYGYRGVDAPAIDDLRRDAILFARAYSHCPLTLPAHASILTGLLPSEHGVRDNLGYRLEPSLPSLLAPLLKRAGRPTGAAVSAYVVRAATGLGQGFDFYDDELEYRPLKSLGESQRPGSETVARALAWVRTVADRPFFLFLHVYEPHTPYAPPPPFAGRYPDPYDGEVAAADAAVGELLAGLRELDLYRRSVVMLLSDHGEGLNDHGEEEHGILLYREALEVPLLVKLPGGRRAGETVAAPAQLIDVVPTLAALAGVEVPAPLGGRSLLALDEEERPIFAETFFPRLHLGWSDLASLVRGRYHHIDGPRPELYDLVADPAERRNLVRAERRTLARLRRELRGYDRTLTPPAAVDAETRERLSALGYLTTTAASREGPLPDPKDKLHLLADLKQGLAHFSRREHAAAVPVFRRLVAESPEMADAWEHLARSLQELGRFEEAGEAFRRALEASGGADHVALGAARLFLLRDRLEDARAHAELALRTSPAAAHETLAQIELAAGRIPAATEQARAALVADSRRVPAIIVLAQVARLDGDLDGARTQIRRAEEILARTSEEPPPGFHFVRGDVLARRGRATAAERDFREEIRLYPADVRPYTNLSLLLAMTGRGGEAVTALRQMVEKNQNPVAYAAAVETLRVLGDPEGAAALLRHARTRFPDSSRLRELGTGPDAGS